MVRFQASVLASGSKGNSVFVCSDRTSLLFDAGVSRKRIFGAIDALGADRSRLAGIVVSHEHSDHIAGIGAIVRALKIPVFISEPTFRMCRNRLEPLPAGTVHFEPGDELPIGDLVVTTLAASHDAVDGSHFVVRAQDVPGHALGIVTDAGYSSNLLITRLHGVSSLILESNHDLRMLMDGPYPWDLKQRIRGRQGHLSNEQAVGLLSQIIHPGLRNLVLAHLSEINNTPELAEKAMRAYLGEIRHDTRLFVAQQDASTPLIDI